MTKSKPTDPTPATPIDDTIPLEVVKPVPTKPTGRAATCGCIILAFTVGALAGRGPTPAAQAEGRATAPTTAAARPAHLDPAARARIDQGRRDAQEGAERAIAAYWGARAMDREGDVRAALATYKTIVARHPDTPAAALATARIRDLIN